MRVPRRSAVMQRLTVTLIPELFHSSIIFDVGRNSYPDSMFSRLEKFAQAISSIWHGVHSMSEYVRKFVVGVSGFAIGVALVLTLMPFDAAKSPPDRQDGAPAHVTKPERMTPVRFAKLVRGTSRTIVYSL